MPYTATNWIDGTTPVNAANMNKLDTGVATLDTAKVDSDAVIAAAARIIASKLLGADTQPAFRILGDGTHSWGAGGASAPDTTLSRSAAGILKAAQHFRAGLDLYAQDGGATQVRIGNNGGNASVDFGSAMDTRLYRNGVGVLGTDGWLKIGANTANEGIRFYDPASNGYGAIWRSNADGALHLQAQTGLYLRPTGAAKIWISNETGVADTNLYRSAADTLKTDDSFYSAVDIAANLGSVANQIWLQASGRIVFGTALDTNLYRSAADILKTDDALEVGTTVKTAPGTLNEVALGRFGPASEPAVRLATDAGATLYRPASGIIKTDGKLNAVGGLQINGVEVPAAVHQANTYLTRPAANTVAAGTVYFATDTLGAWRSDGSTWTLVAQGRPLITPSTMVAAPFTTPYDGQEVVLVSSTTDPSYEWHLRYNAGSTSAYKWECLGGVPYIGYSAGNMQLTTLNTWLNVCSASLSPPRSGEYRVQAVAQSNHPTAGASIIMTFWAGSLPGGIFGAPTQVGFPVAGGYSNILSTGPCRATLTGGSGVAVACQNNIINGNISQVQWEIFPLRVV